MEDLAIMDGMDRFGGTVRTPKMDISDGRATAGVGFKFDDASSRFPAASDILRGDSLYSLRSAGCGNGTIGSGAGRRLGGPRSTAGDSSGIDGLPELFSSFCVGGDASDVSRAPGVTATATATHGIGAHAPRYT
jgi:hypothetical protein